MLTLQALMYIEEHGQTSGLIWNYATGILERARHNADANHIIQLNCRGVGIHAS